MADAGRYSAAANNKGGSSDRVTGANINEIDSLNFAELGYMLRPESAGEFYDGMPLSEYCEAMLNYITKSDENAEKRALLESILYNPRYRDCTVSGIQEVNTYTKDKMEQWGAITISLGDSQKSAVIAYQGTDGTREGWDEDWLLAYSNGTDAQRHSLQYLNDYAAAHPDANIILTGHSKGGNDSIYAYISADENVRAQVSHVYNYDGPGVGFDMDSNPQYSAAIQELDKKLDNYYPQDSIIGQQLQEHGTIHFVYSDGDSKQSNMPFFSEHDAFTWHVNEDGTGFAETEQSVLSRYVNEIMDETLSAMSPEDRQKVVDLMIRMGVSNGLANDKNRGPEKMTLRDFLTNPENTAYIPPVLTFITSVAFYTELWGLDYVEEYLNDRIQERYDAIKQRLDDSFSRAIDGLPESWQIRLKSVGNWLDEKIQEICGEFGGFLHRVIISGSIRGGFVGGSSADFRVDPHALTGAGSDLSAIMGHLLELSARIAQCSLTTSIASYATIGTINIAIAAQAAAAAENAMKVQRLSSKVIKIGALYNRTERSLTSPRPAN